MIMQPNAYISMMESLMNNGSYHTFMLFMKAFPAYHMDKLFEYLLFATRSPISVIKEIMNSIRIDPDFYPWDIQMVANNLELINLLRTYFRFTTYDMTVILSRTRNIEVARWILMQDSKISDEDNLLNLLWSIVERNDDMLSLLLIRYQGELPYMDAIQNGNLSALKAMMTIRSAPVTDEMIGEANQYPSIIKYLTDIRSSQEGHWSTVVSQDNIKKSRDLIRRYTDFIGKPSAQKAQRLVSYDITTYSNKLRSSGGPFWIS